MKNHNLSLPDYWRNFLIISFFLLAVLYSLFGLFFGLDFTDSFYHLNQALHPLNGIYLFPFLLSAIIIKEIAEFAGLEIINLRIINWMLLLFSIIVPFIFLKVKSQWYQVLFYFGVLLILYAPLNANILGYDTLSIFIISLLFSLTAVYISTRKFYLLFLLSTICGAAVLIRVPNALAIPVISIFLLIVERQDQKRSRWQQVFVPINFFFLTVGSVLFFYYLYYYSFEQFIHASSVAESHNLVLLFSNYLKDAVKLFAYIAILLLGLVGYKRFFSNSFSKLQDGILMLFFGVFLVFLVGYTRYSVNYALFLAAFAIAIALTSIYERRGHGRSESSFILYLFLFFLFINSFGSNTGLLKTYSLIVLLPFVIGISELKNQKYWLLLVIVLIPFSIGTKIFGIYEDRNLFVLNEEIKVEKLSSIHTNRIRKHYLEKTDKIIQQLKDKDARVYFYGDKSHIFHYLYPENLCGVNSFYQPTNDPAVLEDIQKNLKGEVKIALFVIDSYPENEQPLEKVFQNFLQNYNFQKVKDGPVTYYLSSPN